MTDATSRHRWGIMGAGGISRRFAVGVGNVDGGELLAVGSSSPQRVETYADEVGAPRAYGSYDQLVADDDVTVVYVGNNHLDHVPAAHLAIEAGKAVLVEKPLAMTATEATELFEHAAARQVFVMEAMWTRFLPATKVLLAMLADGVIGRVRRAEISFGADVDPVNAPRIFDPARAGGSLLDRGIYPISIAHMLIGPADEVVEATAELGGGIDRYTRIVARHGGCEAVLTSACDRQLANTLVLEGDLGRIVVPDPLIRPKSFEIQRGGQTEVVERSFDVHGFEYEIEATHEALEAGWIEHPDWTHADTLATHSVMDEVRRRVGLVYPFEAGPPPAR